MERKAKTSDHFIIAIGASAGGLEAIHEFFDHMPETNNLSFVIIQHLSPDHKSLLVELVSRHTQMKVFEAEHERVIEKNCVYVIPNKKLMTIRRNKLLLADKKVDLVPNTAIDIFLSTLAEEKQENAIAIILSGTGTDGTKGIEIIKEKGGIVMVQDPATAKFDGMPNSAIASGNADYVLPPSDMPDELFSFIHHRPLFIPESSHENDGLLEEVFTLIHQTGGFDFHYYKTPTIIRRISRRMAHYDIRELGAYVDYLRAHPEECIRLGKDFLIGVTRFFRDEPAFELLQDSVIPAILKRKEAGEIIKVWVSACSSGEEAYSMAILFDVCLEKLQMRNEVKIFATDIDDGSIEVASRGHYPFAIEKSIPRNLLDTYFVKDATGYTIIPRIRKQIVFARHNIIKDPPFIKNDLVSCRNMLIYMSPVLQQKVLSVLVFGLQQDGILFLGSSETPTSVKDALHEISGKWKIFQRVGSVKHSSGLFAYSLDGGVKQAQRNKEDGRGAQKNKNRLEDDFQQALSEDLGYAAFYIDQQCEIRESWGSYEQFLSLPKKNLKLNLLKMLPQDLSIVLGGAIKNSWKTEQKVVLKHIRYRKKDQWHAASLIVKPPAVVAGKLHTLVILGDALVDDAQLATGKAHVVPEVEWKEQEYVAELEAELQETKHSLQMAVEGLETTNEELQSSNEELLSANEELQSSNEELQSLNEELHTLNTEHQLKIKELIELNDDLTNYFRSSDIGQVFLDEELRIRKFNPASVKMINFIETDIGRPISHISTNIRYENLADDIYTVLKTGVMLEKEVQLLNGKNLLIRILPYLKQDRVKGGIVIAFVDITAITDLNNIIRGIFNTSHSAIVAFRPVRDADHHIIDFTFQTANQTTARFLQRDQETFLGKSLKKEGGLFVQGQLFDKYLKVVQQDVLLNEDIFVEEGNRWYELTAVKMKDGFVATYTDVTAKKTAEQKLRKNFNELISVKENLKVLNTQLEQMVGERTRELSKSEERFRLVSQATNDAIWDWDFVNNTVWWNDPFFNMFGYERSNYDREFWLSKIHPDERDKVQKSIYAVINSHQSQWTAEYRFLKSDGSYAFILDRAYVLHDEFNTPYRMLGSMVDVTALKNAEREVASNIAQRKFLTESVPLAIWMAGVDRQVDFVNNQFEIYTGIKASEAVRGKWQQSLHPEDLVLLNKTWEQATDSKTGFQMEVRLMRADGAYHWNLLQARVRKDDHGNIIDWLIINTDIHEQKVVNEVLEMKVAQRTAELKTINGELEASNNDLQQFASVASHDLQEPLRKIHMFSKMIKDKYSEHLDEGAQSYLSRILNASNRMRSLITDVLNFSRLSANNYSFEPTDLNVVVEDILDDLEIPISEKKASIHVSRMPVIEVIPGQVRQVFQNLISNSLKFIRPDVQPVIRIENKLVRDKSFDSEPATDGEYCIITISDNGIGFDDQFKNSIFTLFQRLHSKDKFEGSGIGLAITKKIIDKHGGLISAHSKEGEGATFMLLLPVKQYSEALV
ncbi:two-component system, chemotaxis family, CheB/CheR fusion protein [Filimonas lacunae]|uniref:histidine kinase n=1 Tax=Filimonas lacunae TaxID=477680 RepID=A0A173MPA9_9BACT|nr:chemotaxis protein CheB [Filimonas lacunae]BAV09515.1 chemotaxis protein methyltransferase CheR [Filimonas lacunae]SIS74503.1 two-component system, chemotaxis family, CheB/CheR fusion protein [Filimonas lacunae]